MGIHASCEACNYIRVASTSGENLASITQTAVNLNTWEVALLLGFSVLMYLFLDNYKNVVPLQHNWNIWNDYSAEKKP